MFPEQSGGSQTDPRSQDALEFSLLFWHFSYLTLVNFKVKASVTKVPEYGSTT